LRDTLETLSSSSVSSSVNKISCQYLFQNSC
jgi:hypothetical protein